MKRLPRPPGGDRDRPGQRQARRNLVRRRGQGWAEEQENSALGATRHTALSTARPAHGISLHLRGDLPGPGQGRWPGAAALHDRGHGPRTGRDRPDGRAGRSRHHLLDRAGWHLSKRLTVPANLTLVPLPAKAPELNSMENVWQVLRENWLSNRIFTSYKDVLDHCCDAWKRLTDQPWRIMSIGLRKWAHITGSDQCTLV